MKRTKKQLGKFLENKKSWKKIIKYLEKYLNKRGNWNYIYEFDAGKVSIIITAIGGGKSNSMENKDVKIKKRRKHGK